MRINTPMGEYETETINYYTAVTDYEKETYSKQQLMELMLARARQEIAHVLEDMNNVIEINTEYDIVTQRTLINHQLVVLRRTSNGTK